MFTDKIGQRGREEGVSERRKERSRVAMEVRRSDGASGSGTPVPEFLGEGAMIRRSKDRTGQQLNL